MTKVPEAPENRSLQVREDQLGIRGLETNSVTTGKFAIALKSEEN
jgi:hypothetical protein